MKKRKRDGRQTFMGRPLFSGRLFEKWKARRKIFGGGNAVLMDISMQKFRDLIYKVTSELGLAKL